LRSGQAEVEDSGRMARLPPDWAMTSVGPGSSLELSIAQWIGIGRSSGSSSGRMARLPPDWAIILPAEVMWERFGHNTKRGSVFKVCDVVTCFAVTSAVFPRCLPC
jgi:hypothetical protein